MSTQSQTTTINNKAEHRRYGFLSILALVIGSVIGSGIFFKNDAVNATTQSGFISFLGWMVIAAVVLMIATASLELFSSKKAHKRAGLSGLTTTFIGPRTGKFVGMFFVYAYFPASLAAVSVYAGSLATDAIAGAGVVAMQDMAPWVELAVTTAIGIGLMGAVGVINTLTEKPGKIFQTFGTGFQLLPLTLVLFLVIFLISAPGLFQAASGNGLETGTGSSWDPYSIAGIPQGSGAGNLFDFESTVNGGVMLSSDGAVTAYGMEESGGAVFGTLLLALPPIMFTFDGFLFASSLQTEAKTPRTYPVALITGLVVISIVYLGVAVGTVATATVPPLFTGAEIHAGATVVRDGITYNLSELTDGWNLTNVENSASSSYVLEQHQQWWEMGGVAALVGRLLPQAATWLPQTVSFIIVISTLTTIQGFFITGSRELANLAHADVIADTNGFYLRRNKAGVPQNSAWTLFAMTFIWMFVAKGLDAIMLADQTQGWTEFGKEALANGTFNGTLATDFTSNFVVIVAFVMYVMPLVGGMVNRFTNKIDDVQRSKLFWPTAVLSVAVVALLTVTNVLSTFAINFAHNPLQILNVILLLVTIGVPIYFSLMAGRKAKLTSKEQWEQKEFFKAAYESLQTPEEYEAAQMSARAGKTGEIKLEKVIENKIKEEVVKRSDSSVQTNKIEKEKVIENKINEKPVRRKSVLPTRAQLRKRTLVELKSDAKKLGVKGYSKVRKEELIDILFKAYRK